MAFLAGFENPADMQRRFAEACDAAADTGA